VGRVPGPPVRNRRLHRDLDLGEVVRVRLLAIQADANDTYNIWGSLDGKDYKVMGRSTRSPATGCACALSMWRYGGAFPARGRGQGRRLLFVSEVAAYCQTPTPFPPQFKVLDAPAATAPKTYLDYWNSDTSARWEMILAILAAILLWWERRLTGLGMAAFSCVCAGFSSGQWGCWAFCPSSFRFLALPGFVHGWDTFHYYVGAKYFKEMHYERLYECVALPIPRSQGCAAGSSCAR